MSTIRPIQEPPGKPSRELRSSAKNVSAQETYFGARWRSSYLAILPIMMMVFSAETSAEAAVIVNASQTDSGVVFTSSGTLDLTSWRFCCSLNLEKSGVYQTWFSVGPEAAPTDFYWGSAYWESADGPGFIAAASEITYASSGSGDAFHFFLPFPLAPAESPAVHVPEGYVFGEPISGKSTFANETFDSMGLTPDSYTWTWGDADNGDSITLNIVPEPRSRALLLIGLLPFVRPRYAG